MDWKKNFEKLFATLYKPKILLLDLNRNVHICAPKHTKMLIVALYVIVLNWNKIPSTVDSIM